MMDACPTLNWCKDTKARSIRFKLHQGYKIQQEHKSDVLKKMHNINWWYQKKFNSKLIHNGLSWSMTAAYEIKDEGNIVLNKNR